MLDRDCASGAGILIAYRQNGRYLCCDCVLSEARRMISMLLPSADSPELLRLTSKKPACDISTGAPEVDLTICFPSPLSLCSAHSNETG